MATTRKASAHWEGALKDGKGTVSLDSSQVATFDVTWLSRAEQPEGRTSPEELIAAAHASCFAMALSLTLDQAGHRPDTLDTSAEVGFQAGQGITGITLRVRGRVPGISEDDFVAAAQDAKANCPVSKALQGTSIELDASLAS